MPDNHIDRDGDQHYPPEDHPPTPASKADLGNALDSLLCTAYENGVPIDDGACILRHDEPDVPDWQVHVTRLAKSAPDGT